MSAYEYGILNKDLIDESDRLELLDHCMTQYGTEIKRLVYAYVRNHADTDDVVQEVFITVYQKIDQFQHQSELKSWIYRIAINKSKDHLRGFKHRQQRLKQKLEQTFKKEATNQQTPEQVSLQTEESKKLLVQVYQLPIKYKEVIILYYFEQLSVKEIADILNINTNTIKARLKRGRERLKEKIESDGGDQHG
ncbi:sigma-70 family RNA polymerase sigma factor [Alkalibacillus aidingensis]|uniref:sigma-70 family RNA polymerase sigma factor n=1 Tax=Alkalibacillus aidingensis TaxID=2747607 RepID=UPI001660B917|nr:sigma-70 family RNA polymerase sigma factor [Alkalibacillus aidingensis]